MAKFVTHEAIDGGIFNRDFSTATGQVSQWDAELQNNPETLSLMMERLELDFVSQSSKIRVAYKFAHVEIWPTNLLTF